MTATSIVLRDSTETFVSYPPGQYLGQASSADVRVGTPSTPTPDEGDEQAATVDDVSASTNAAAEVGDDSLSFAVDPECTPGWMYLLEHSSFGALTVLVQATGATLRLAEPLPVDVPSGATLKGLAISHALTADETSADGRCTVFVRATIGGVQRAWTHTFRIYPRAFAQRLTAVELIQLAPEMARYRSATDPTYGEAIAAGYEQILSDLETQKYLADRIYTVEKLNLAVAACILWRARRSTDGPADDDTLAAKGEYSDELAKALQRADFWYSATNDSSTSPATNTAALRGIRMSL